MSLKSVLLGGSIVLGVSAVALGVVVSLPGATSAECSADIVFLGLRGSGQAGPKGLEYTSDPADMGSTISEVFTGFQGLQGDVHPVAIGYEAVSVHQGIPFGQYTASRDDGVNSLDRKLKQLMGCSSPPEIVLAGYSQGADAVKQALKQYEDSANLIPRIAAVVLVADPTWKGNELNYRIGDANPSHTGFLTSVSMPSALLDRTLAVCNDKDLICNAPGWTTAHSQYASTGWLPAAGRWAARVYQGKDVIPGFTGQIVRNSATGDAWLVEADGRKWIPDGGDYLCWVNDYGIKVKNVIGATIDIQPDAWGRHAKCTPKAVGSGTKKITLSKGAVALSGYWYNVSLSGFPSGQTVTVKCHDSVDSGGFISVTITVNSAGTGYNPKLCYSGDGPDHWVTSGGVTSNKVSWSGGGGVSPPPTQPATSGLSFKVSPTSCAITVCNSQAKAMKGVMSGFTPNSTVRIWVYLPDGRDANTVGGSYGYITTASTKSNGTFTWLYWWDPGMVTGTYKTKIQDNATGKTVMASFTFTKLPTTTTTKPPQVTTTTSPPSTVQPTTTSPPGTGSVTYRASDGTLELTVVAECSAGVSIRHVTVVNLGGAPIQVSVEIPPYGVPGLDIDVILGPGESRSSSILTSEFPDPWFLVLSGPGFTNEFSLVAPSLSC